LQLYFKIVTDPKLGLPAPYLSPTTCFMGFYPHLPIAHIYLAVLSLSLGEFKQVVGIFATPQDQYTLFSP
jgi:hypothetical protein